jgi:alkylation response protein AidB-like acyl-CoA dehydrogenase
MPSNPLVDSRDMRFVLFEMLEAHRLTAYAPFADFDRDTFESVLELAEQIAVEQVYPANAPGDRIGAHFDPATGTVAVPEVFVQALEAFNDAGFTGIANDPRWGGSGMPDIIYRAAMEYFFAAGISFTMNISLLVGATNLVKKYYTGEDKDLILKKMITGTWGGTMCLTEPEAGSDVGALKTRAVKQSDGSYLITGQKIFISAGDNDLFENIIHPVLARIEGDPAGTRGISIFLVPKYRFAADGTLAGDNDVACSGIEHKMGIKASPTCTLNFGDNGRCVGFLMGEERQGMKIMFQMMNEARLDVALQGLAVSSSAYMHAVTYANNRCQGFDPVNKGAGPAMIISHPDVKRMLLWMKSQVEVMRMVTMLAAMQTDLAHHAQGGEASKARALLDFLIPICKAGNTDLAWLVTGEAVQVYGGYGYCADYPVEQLARDSKILAIYEGTNGIQSMDLAMRKLLMNPGMENFTIYRERICDTVTKAAGTVDEKYIGAITLGLARMDDLVACLQSLLKENKTARVLALATPLQHAFRMLTHAWMHLWSLSLTGPRLARLTAGLSGDELASSIEDNSEAAYYHGKCLASRFYLGSEFQKYFGLVDAIMSGEGAVTEACPCSFTGALP